MYTFDEIEKTDSEIADAIKAEMERQNSHIELIASENWVSKAVMAAMGSPLTNKYAEGYPGKRYYGGCQCVDVVENLARDRAKELFGCEYANVQPHSGAQANLAVFFAMLEPGDKVMGMNLDHGGHLTHGSPVNISGKYFNFVSYGLGDDETIDYDKVAALAKEHKPKMIVAGASAYPRIIDFPKLAEIAKSVGAYLMVDMAHIAGLVAAGVHPSPVPYADITTTTTHKTLRGPRGGLILCNDEELAKKINKAVFVFAGGTAHSFNDFLPGDDEERIAEFQRVKGPDFVSRLKGILNIRGLNPDCKTDRSHIIRRAMLLRQQIIRRIPSVYDEETGKVNISNGLLFVFFLVLVFCFFFLFFFYFSFFFFFL